MLDATLIFTGYADYWDGYANRIDEDISEHLLYAYYGPETTLHDIIDQLVEDSWTGPASETIPKGITKDDVRKALLERMLSEPGRVDYEAGIIAECSAEWMEARDCDEYCTDGVDDSESQVFITLLTYRKN